MLSIKNEIEQIIRSPKTGSRVCIYASLFLLLTSCMMQYPFQISEINTWNDAESYKKASEWLYAPEHFASFGRPFLFSLLIGFPSLLGFGYSEYFVAALNLIAWVSIVWLLFRAGKSMLDEKTGFKMALLFASCVSLHCFAVLVHTEVIFSFVLLSHVFCLYKYLKLGKESWFYSAVWLLGASVVIRPTLTYFVFVLYFVLVVLTIFRKIRLKKFMLISLLFLSTVGLQMFNMYRFTHSFRISYIGEVDWYMLVSAYAINVKNYPNQSIDFYAKEWQKEINRRQEGTWLIGSDYTKEDAQRLPAIENLIKADMIKQLSENKKGLAFTFFRSLFVNSRSGTQYALSVKNNLNLPFFTTIQNVFLKISQCQNLINSGFVLLILPITFLNRYRKQRGHLDKIFGLALYSWFVAFSVMVFSTVAFTQGDRFHVVTVPLTLFTFGLLFFQKQKLNFADLA
jgi:4-amino-4-deoxy-L-arabinose transferase-like glycosyltransferase